MERLPDWVLKHKKSGTEIGVRNGSYDLYIREEDPKRIHYDPGGNETFHSLQ